LPESALLEEAFSEKAGRRVALKAPQRGETAKMIRQARRNAEEELDRRLAETSTQARLLAGLAETFGLERVPRRGQVDLRLNQGQNRVCFEVSWSDIDGTVFIASSVPHGSLRASPPRVRAR